MKTKGTIYLFFGILCELYFIGTIIFGGIITFAEFYLALGLLLITLGLYQRKNKKDYILIRPGKIKTVIKLCFSIVLVSVVIIESLIIQSAIIKNKQKSDYLIILGAGLRGEVPSIALFQRLYASLEYIEINPTVKIVVSGGRGFGESITEAEAMKRFLIKHGVAKDQIIKEEKSVNTFENMKFTAEILRKVDKKENIEVTIVTNNFHVLRSKFLAQRQGLKAYGYPAPLHPMLVPTCFAREYLAVINSYLFDK
ncbi:YdcF family protein [Clostridium lacusfryxellense]|uniref:YdcF family protein n=1 Tax=Clostridium lacusfryxellense TaxID=205328 RepID=UPI001C0D0D2C|nr:YdcF family protein [Clostridium lacusfryxellense]MBU3109941.1 YdcF family protein [Clostridium lacusfryxellense]